MHVKGLEIPEQEPRVSKGSDSVMLLQIAVRIICMACLPLIWVVILRQRRKIFPAEIIDELMESYNEKYKPDMLIYGEHFCALSDAFGVCKFTTTEEYSLMPSDS